MGFGHKSRDDNLDTFVSKSSSLHGAGGGTRTHTVSPPTDFESVTSTNSITPAGTGMIIQQLAPVRKGFSIKILQETIGNQK